MPNYNAAKNNEISTIKIFDETFQQLYDANLDEKGVALIYPFLYGRQKSNFWIEFGNSGDLRIIRLFFTETIQSESIRRMDKEFNRLNPNLKISL